MKVIGNDKFASCRHSIARIEKRDYTYVQSTVLAYNESEKDLFLLNPINRSEIKLSITNKKTPELFYGIAKGTDFDKHTTDVWGEEGNAFYWYNISNNDPRSVTFKGRIFRTVSQLNMNITEIPVSGVKRIELYGDNYPTEINLNGDHGEFYPVTAAGAGQTTGQYTEADETDKGAWIESPNYVLLDAKDIAEGDEEITLSSFLLPSTQGMRLKMRIEFSEDAVNLEDDDLIIKVEGEGDNKVTRYFKDYNIRPGQSYTIEDGADIYTTATQEQHYNNDQSSKDLYVYNNNEGKMCFYSYSNVRVTMSGKLEDIAGETGQSNIEIEVEPGFEKVHDIPLN